MARKKTQAAGKAAAETAVKSAEAEAAGQAEGVVKAPAKPAARKTAKRPEIKTEISVQYMGKDISGKDMVAMVKKDWTGKMNKIGDIKTMELYVKVEENMVYYVINGSETGSVAI